jgi:hypothetical protein
MNPDVPDTRYVGIFEIGIFDIGTGPDRSGREARMEYLSEQLSVKMDWMDDMD